MGITISEKPKGSGIHCLFIHKNGKPKSKKVGSKTEARQLKNALEYQFSKEAIGLVVEKDSPKLYGYALT